MTAVLIDCRLMFYRKAGISMYTRRLVQALAAMPAPPQVQVLLDRRDQDTQWIPATVPVRRAFTPAHHRYEAIALPLELLVLMRQAPALGSSRSALAGRRPPLVHFPDFIACAGRFRKVITIHDLYFMEHPEVMSDDGARYYERIHESVQRADAIIAVSQFTRDDIVRLMPQVPTQKITVVHEAGEGGEHSAGAVVSLAYLHPPKHLSSSPYALFVGTFEPRKNLATLLHALRYTPHDLRLIIVGEAGWANGGEPARLARELGLTERVQLAGRVSDAELDQLYREARMLVFPSLSEGFGLPALEAMARGTPVVCANTGSLPEIVGSAALLHDPLNVQQLAQHMCQLWLDDALYAEYRARGQGQAAQFSWPRCAHETLAIYTELAR